MKKIIAALLFCFASSFKSEGAALNFWITDHTNHGVGDYKTVTCGSYVNTTGGTTYTMACDGDGTNCCEWLIANNPNPSSFTQAYVDQMVAIQIANGNPTGQIYINGNSGIYTIQNISSDQSGIPSYLWQVSGPATNQIIQTLIFE